MSGYFESIIDWDTCKIQYELLGESLDRIAAIHGIAVDSLQRVSAEEKWRRTDDYDAYLNSTEDVIRRKLKLAVLLRDMDLFPQVTAIENTIIQKVQQTCQNIVATDPKAAGQLRALGQCLNSLLDRPMPQLIVNTSGEKINPRDLMWEVEIKDVEEKLEQVAQQQGIVNI